MNNKAPVAIWWIKRDFRLSDNSALTEALYSTQQVLPLFTFEPSICGAQDYSPFHRQACWQAVTALRNRIKHLGGDLWLAEEEIESVITEIRKFTLIQEVFSHEETGASFTFDRDQRLKTWFRAEGIVWREFPTNGIIRGLKDRNQRSTLWNQRLSRPVIAAPVAIPLAPQLVALCEERWERLSVRNYVAIEAEAVSESAAMQRLESFLGWRGRGYSGGISSPNTAFEAGSRLSAQLAWGTISLRQVIAAQAGRLAELAGSPTAESKHWRKSLTAFKARLHWHDHFIQRLESEPGMEFSCLNSLFEELPFRSDAERLERWINGHTGVPLIDACMRCLRHSGFLNFRMRAMIVSYACHVLHLSWRDIQYPLARLFLDYEPGIHISQIQMQAGVVGINTLRVYSPDKQMLDHDPHLVFVKRWVPEIREFSNREIYDYLKQPLAGYMRPMVDYKSASTIMKNAVYSVKRTQAGREASKTVLEKHGSRKNSGRRNVPNDRQLSLFKRSAE